MTGWKMFRWRKRKQHGTTHGICKEVSAAEKKARQTSENSADPSED